MRETGDVNGKPDTGDQYWLRFLQVLVLVQFLFLCYANLRYTSHILNGDGADLFNHVMEMAKQHTIYIPGWKYATTLELDCSALLALPIYMVT